MGFLRKRSIEITIEKVKKGVVSEASLTGLIFDVSDADYCLYPYLSIEIINLRVVGSRDLGDYYLFSLLATKSVSFYNAFIVFG